MFNNVNMLRDFFYYDKIVNVVGFFIIKRVE